MHATCRKSLRKSSTRSKCRPLDCYTLRYSMQVLICSHTCDQVFYFLRILLARVSSEHLTSIWPVVLMELIRVFQVRRTDLHFFPLYFVTSSLTSPISVHGQG